MLVHSDQDKQDFLILHPFDSQQHHDFDLYIEYIYIKAKYKNLNYCYEVFKIFN